MGIGSERFRIKMNPMDCGVFRPSTFFHHVKWHVKMFFFESSRGIRQGDPLSHFLFTFVADTLSNLMAKAKYRGIIKGFPNGNAGFAINHLQFADDTICFLKAEKSQVLLLKDTLRIFEIIYGLKSNLSKTTMADIVVGAEEVLHYA